MLGERRKGFEENMKKIVILAEKGGKGFRFSHLNAMNRMCIWKRGFIISNSMERGFRVLL